MFILGISAFYHDSAACLLKDGILVSAAEEERFTRKKNDNSFPINAIRFCLKDSKIDITNIDLIVFYEKPFLKFDRILNSIQRTAPVAFNLFRESIQSWLKVKLWIPSLIKEKLNYKGEIIFSEHHEAHAAAAFFTSPFSESAVITIDGVGEKACTTIAKGQHNHVTILKEQHYPHSFGLFYSAFTQYCGFKINSGEYKLMGLAPYGNPVYKELILEKIISISHAGEVKLNLKYFSFDKGKSTINKAFCNIFNMRERTENEEMSTFYKDIASSVQSIADDFIISIATHAKEITASDNLCLAGGVALNCKANGNLLYEQVFKNVWVQPAAGDSGASVGAGYIGWNHYLNKKRIPVENTLPKQAFLGIEYTIDEIDACLKHFQINFSTLDDDELCNEVSAQLIDKKIAGWFQGRMEFGPRALGNRSILASPLFEDMKQHLNMRIKQREGFRPFAPIVLEEYAHEWFTGIGVSKYMSFTFKSSKKNVIPSCIHEDETARVQTLSKNDHPLLHKLISVFKQKTDCPVLINTSFNVRGEPIIASPTEALKCFFQTDMDVLVLGNNLITKKENSKVHAELTKKETYELD
ncbi:MAG: carbamoyltransferase N-terminal domain-containing protein [Bacteroidota bacterium]